MADNNINAKCCVCGTGYHICRSCLEQKEFKPWRTVTDSIDHYKIYLVVHNYGLSKDKENAKKEAREQLQTCDLTGLANFNPNFKSIIEDILSESYNNENIQKRKRRKTVSKDENISE